MTDLNAEVAERVMGWERADPDDAIGWWETRAPGIQTLRTNFNPDISIADAWLVVEEMRKRGFTTFIRVGLTDEAYPCYIKVLHEDGSEADSSTGKVPEAICRAALEAVK
jgi:hypothetical protein